MFSSYEDAWAAAQPHSVGMRLRSFSRSSRRRQHGYRPRSGERHASRGESRFGARWLHPGRVAKTRAAPHGSKCFIGAKGTSQIEVCAALTRVRTQVKIASPPCNFWTRHQSSRAHGVRLYPAGGQSQRDQCFHRGRQDHHDVGQGSVAVRLGRPDRASATVEPAPLVSTCGATRDTNAGRKCPYAPPSIRLESRRHETGTIRVVVCRSVKP
jgi:hypothetical protein